MTPRRGRESDRGSGSMKVATRESVLVRYGEWTSIGVFEVRSRLAALQPGDPVIVRTPRGREWARC